MDEATTIRVKKATKEKLSKCGNTGQTYDDVINMLINKGDKNGNKKTIR